jgi:hypothetical protein
VLSVVGVIGAMVGLTVVLWLPTVLAIGWQNTRRYSLAVVTLGPVLTLLVAAWIRAVTDVGDVRYHWTMLPGLSLATASAIASVRWSASRRRGAHTDLNTTVFALLVERLTCFRYRWLAPAVALAIAVAASGTLTLGFIDGPRHAYFVSEMMASGRTSPSHVLTEFPGSGIAAGRYYQLALHLVIASLADATGLAVADIIQALGILLMGVLGPASIALATAAVTNSQRALAISPTLAAAVIAPFAQAWAKGWLPYAIGLAIVSATTGLWVTIGGADRRVAEHGLVALCLSAALALHPGTFALAGVVIAASCAVQRHRLAAACSVAVASVVLCLPESLLFLSGTIERSGGAGDLVDGMTVAGAAGFFLTAQTSLVATPLVLLAIGVLVRDRSAVNVIVGAACGLMVGLALMVCAADSAWARRVTFPWNGDPTRLIVNALVLILPFCASGAVEAWDRLSATTSNRRFGSLLPRVGLAAAALIGWAAVAHELGSYTIAQQRDGQAAWRFVAANTSPGDTVIAGTAADGGLWLNTLDGGATLFGWPTEFRDQNSTWMPRVELFRMALLPDTDPRQLAREADRFCARYVIVDDELPLDVVSEDVVDPTLTQVFRSGTVSVFELPTDDPPGQNCASSSALTVASTE